MCHQGGLYMGPQARSRTHGLGSYLAGAEAALRPGWGGWGHARAGCALCTRWGRATHRTQGATRCERPYGGRFAPHAGVCFAPSAGGLLCTTGWRAALHHPLEGCFAPRAESTYGLGARCAHPRHNTFSRKSSATYSTDTRTHARPPPRHTHVRARPDQSDSRPCFLGNTL